MNKQKGSDFERLICKDLSLWWTDGQRDDIFWRTSLSGGRATVRRKTGRATDLQCGDISAIDPIGVPLIRQITFELKRGYGKVSPFDLLDANHTATLEWLCFLHQVQAARQAAGTPFWAIVFQRDRHSTCIAIPLKLWMYRQEGSIPDPSRIIVRVKGFNFVVLTYTDFKQFFTPEWFLTQDEFGGSFDD